MSIKLVVTKSDGPDETDEYRFDRLPVVIGRAGSSHLTLPDQRRIISKEHAQVAEEGDGYQLVDLGSKNYTYLNGQRLEAHQPVPLRDGDTFTIGDFAIKFVKLDAPPAVDYERTVFDFGFTGNPFEEPVQQLAEALGALREQFDSEDPGRRQEALRDALKSTFVGSGGHQTETLVAEALGGVQPSTRLGPATPTPSPSPRPPAGGQEAPPADPFAPLPPLVKAEPDAPPASPPGGPAVPPPWEPRPPDEAPADPFAPLPPGFGTQEPERPDAWGTPPPADPFASPADPFAPLPPLAKPEPPGGTPPAASPGGSARAAAGGARADRLLDVYFEATAKLAPVPWRFRYEFIGQTIMQPQDAAFLYESDPRELRKMLLSPDLPEATFSQRLEVLSKALSDLALHQVALLDGYRAAVQEGAARLLDTLDPIAIAESGDYDSPLYKLLPSKAKGEILEEIEAKAQELRAGDWSALEGRIYRPAFAKAYLARMTSYHR